MSAPERTRTASFPDLPKFPGQCPVAGMCPVILVEQASRAPLWVHLPLPPASWSLSRLSCGDPQRRSSSPKGPAAVSAESALTPLPGSTYPSSDPPQPHADGTNRRVTAVHPALSTHLLKNATTLLLVDFIPAAPTPVGSSSDIQVWGPASGWEPPGPRLSAHLHPYLLSASHPSHFRPLVHPSSQDDHTSD